MIAMLFAAALAADAPASSESTLLALAHQAGVEDNRWKTEFYPLPDHHAEIGKPVHLDFGPGAKRLSVVFTDDQIMVRTFMPTIDIGHHDLPYFELKRELAKAVKYDGPNPYSVKLGPRTQVEMQYALMFVSGPARDDPDNQTDFLFRTPGVRADEEKLETSAHVILDGKIAKLPSGHATGCDYGELDLPQANVPAAKVCYVGVALSHVAFVDSASGKVLKEWNAPPAKPY
jgi:hypothetical protein